MVASLELMKDKNKIITKDVINSDIEASSSFGGLNLDGTMCDYEIICQGQKFSCHKTVLATNSKVFEVFTHIFTLIVNTQVQSGIPKVTYLAPRTAVRNTRLSMALYFHLLKFNSLKVTYNLCLRKM